MKTHRFKITLQNKHDLSFSYFSGTFDIDDKHHTGNSLEWAAIKELKEHYKQFPFVLEENPIYDIEVG